jgi:UDP-N-acetylglucosamine/UDP-N-acetylgalactosamine diphosphorylase
MEIGRDAVIGAEEGLRQRLSAHGQEHLVGFWSQLDGRQREALAAQIRGLDLELIDRLYGHPQDQVDVRQLAERAAPPPSFKLGAGAGGIQPQAAQARGAEALRAGRVGAMLVAGGQGTRLGFDHPKGMFPIGPISQKPLFQIHVEKILAASRRYGVRIPLYLMTSPATHHETLEFFAANDRFGLPEEDLFVFCQGTMPAVDAATGKILLAAPDQIALSPDGHGGMLAAFHRSGGLRDARDRGIRHLFYFQVDNPLVDICSPEFLGYHLLAHSEMTSQVVRKQEPLEKVGNVVRVDGRLRVIEYSDLPDDVARRRGPDGSLDIWAGSIAVHVLETAFLGAMVSDAHGLPFHYARKKVAHVDPSGNQVQPKEPNAIKFERFIFDLMPSANGAVVVEVDPAEHFAPLKNAPGEAKDTPEAVRAQMIALHSRWLRDAGVAVGDGVPVEISPLYALDAEELAQRVAKTPIAQPTYLESR